jgi:hypothetical protein
MNALIGPITVTSAAVGAYPLHVRKKFCPALYPPVCAPAVPIRNLIRVLSYTFKRAGGARVALPSFRRRKGHLSFAASPFHFGSPLFSPLGGSIIERGRPGCSILVRAALEGRGPLPGILRGPALGRPALFFFVAAGAFGTTRARCFEIPRAPRPVPGRKEAVDERGEGEGRYIFLHCP